MKDIQELDQIYEISEINHNHKLSIITFRNYRN